MAVPAHERRGRSQRARASARGGDATAASERRPRRPDSAEVVQRLHENSSEGGGLAYARLSKSIHRIVWRLLGADADRDDIVQQVFLKIIEHRQSLREPERLRAWIQAITVNAVYEELRKREVRRAALRELPVREALPSLVHEVEVLDPCVG